MQGSEGNTLRVQLPGAGAQQAQAKHGTAVGVDAPGGRQHACLGIFSKCLQHGK